MKNLFAMAIIATAIFLPVPGHAGERVKSMALGAAYGALFVDPSGLSQAVSLVMWPGRTSAAALGPIAITAIATAPARQPTTRAPCQMLLPTLAEVYWLKPTICSAGKAGITMRMFYLTVTAGLCAVASCAWAGVSS